MKTTRETWLADENEKTQHTCWMTLLNLKIFARRWRFRDDDATAAATSLFLRRVTPVNDQTINIHQRMAQQKSGTDNTPMVAQ